MISLKTSFQFIEKYSLFIVLLFAFQLLTPEFAAKAALMERELAAFNDNIAGSDTLKRIFWVSCSLILAFCLLTQGVRYISRASHALILSWAAILTTCSVSILWSDYPSYTLKRVLVQCLVIFSITAAIFFSIKHETFDKNVKYLLIGSVAAGAIALVVQGGVPASGFSGWAKSKNSFGGYVLALLLMVYLKGVYEAMLDREPKRDNLIFALILSVFLLLSMSKTSIALGGLLVLLIYFSGSFNKPIFLFVFTLIIAIKVVLPGLALWYGAEWNIAMLMDAEDFTGRGYIWKLLYQDLFYFEKFHKGYGYGAYFGVGEAPLFLADDYSYVQYLNSAHNSYIELLLQVGVICTLIILLVLALMVVNLNVAFVYVCATVIALHGVSESSLLKDIHVMWLMFIISLAFGSYVYKKHSPAENTATVST